jgi:hypothetical protein
MLMERLSQCSSVCNVTDTDRKSAVLIGATADGHPASCHVGADNAVTALLLHEHGDENVPWSIFDRIYFRGGGVGVEDATEAERDVATRHAFLVIEFCMKILVSLKYYQGTPRPNGRRGIAEWIFGQTVCSRNSACPSHTHKPE